MHSFSLFSGSNQVPATSPGRDINLNGGYWISYNTSELEDVLLTPNSREQLNIQFRTRDSEGVLWASSSANREVVVAVQVHMHSSNSIDM